MQTLTIERKPPLTRREKNLVFVCVLISGLSLMGILLPGYALTESKWSFSLALSFAVLLYLGVLWWVWSNPYPRSQMLFKAWGKENPELLGRLKEVFAQAEKDPDGIGFFAHALNLIHKDPERSTLLKGLYYRTGNKTQLQVALCRERWDGMDPSQTWALDATVRVAAFTDLRDLLRNIYYIATVGYLGGILLYLSWSSTKALVAPIIRSPHGQSWLWTLVAPATILGVSTFYLNLSKYRADRVR